MHCDRCCLKLLRGLPLAQIMEPERHWYRQGVNYTRNSPSYLLIMTDTDTTGSTAFGYGTKACETNYAGLHIKSMAQLYKIMLLIH
jgi:hypothetical protein